MASVEKFGRVRGEATLNQSQDDITINEPWRLILSSPTLIGDAYGLLDGLVGQDGFPKLGDPYSSTLSGVLCVDRSIDHDQNQRGSFIITVKYSNAKEDSEGDTGRGDDPIDKPTVYSYTAVDNLKVVSKDTKTGKLITYTNGRVVTPPFTENFPLTRVTVNRNESNYNNVSISRFQSKINKGSLRIDGRSYGEGTVQFENVSATSQYKQDGTKYYSVTYTLLINVEGFKRKVINADNYPLVNRKPPLAAKPKRTTDGEPRKLNEQGFAVSAEDEIDPEKFIELEFNTLDLVSMNGLRL